MKKIGDLVASAKDAVYEGSPPALQARYRAAERRKEVIGAFQAVCAGTREGSHVTGLHYLPEMNELIVYTDGASWTQELFLMREIIRARMDSRGAKVDALVFRTSRPGYVQSRAAHTPPQRRHRESTPVPLTPKEKEELDRSLENISHPELRETLKKAERANREWLKGKKAKEGPEQPPEARREL